MEIELYNKLIAPFFVTVDDFLIPKEMTKKFSVFELYVILGILQKYEGKESCLESLRNSIGFVFNTDDVIYYETECFLVDHCIKIDNDNFQKLADIVSNKLQTAKKFSEVVNEVTEKFKVA